jgi:hypothetical protein
MFEQSLYENDTRSAPAQPASEGDLFYDYEIKTWQFTPRIYKIIGIATALNILGLVVFSQASLLTMRGCDSPLVGRFCDALDTVMITTKLLGTEREYVDAVYDRTTLSDDEEVIFVDVSGETPPISYPEGYFQVANPVQYQELLAAANDPTTSNSFPGIPYSPPSSSGDLFNTPFTPPPANNDVIDGELPTLGNNRPSYNPPPVRNNRPQRPNRQRPVPTRTPADTVAGITDDDKVPEPVPTPLSPEDALAVEINKRPLTDFADDVSTRWASKDVDLNQEFMIVMNGVITKDGKLDRAKSKFDVSKQRGDEKMIDVAKSAIEAVGDTGFLVYLQTLGIDKVSVTLFQDQEKVVAVVSSAQKNAESAKRLTTALSNYISFGKIATKDPSDERTLLNAATVITDGKEMKLNFVLPKPIAQELINRKLQEAQARKNQTPQPNSGASATPYVDAGLQ